MKYQLWRRLIPLWLMAQVCVVDILFYMYVSEHFEQSYQNLQKTSQAIKQLGQEPSS